MENERTIIIRETVTDGEKNYCIDVLRKGYNIIAFTIYDGVDDAAKAIMDAIAEKESEG